MCYLGHPKVVKGYMLYRFDNESPKIVTSKNMIFNESVMYKDTFKDFGVCTDKSVEELQVKVELHGLNNRIEGVQKPRYKARFVDCRFTQRAGIDYNEVFSLVVRYTSIRVILALTACKDYKLEQLNVKMTFLHGNVVEVIYIRQLPGYEQDDMLIACKIKAEIGSTKSLLKKEFEMKELAEAKKILVKILLAWHFKLSLKDFMVMDCDVKRMIDDMLAVDDPDAVDVGYKLRVVLCRLLTQAKYLIMQNEALSNSH
uniref:Retrovirus-related Pol polyprotein from transposon TNT 1-94 n=1 Tax=Tanacetum cinerariifolium TaxID=118510 RepID=A0A6L2KTD3_TANCI|nr:retrovirus-related Pol polyprotein from transposon TNT 1-94 [Tanacetum cinerariifolium]